MTFTIRAATPADIATILRFITDLAIYEQAPEQVEVTPDQLTASLFGPQPAAQALICERDGQAIGYAIWFYSYSTWKGRRGLFLEDLYIDPAARGQGAGRAVLRHLARLALDKDCARFEWNVLDWNQPAIRAYQAIGAEPLSEWTRYRLDGARLQDFADGRENA